MKKPEPETKETIEIQNFTINDVLTTIQLKDMSRKNMARHIEYLEKVALGLNNGLTMAIEQLNVKVRAKDGTIV